MSKSSNLTPAQREEKARLRREKRKRKRLEQQQKSKADKQASQQHHASEGVPISANESRNHDPNPPDNNQAQAAANQNPASESDNQLPRERFVKTRLCFSILNVLLTLLFTGAVAVFSGFQVYYGNKQWEAMESQNIKFDSQIGIMQEQVKQTDESLALVKGSQRAWLGATVEAPPGYADFIPILWNLTITNLGQTPGTVRAVYAAATTWEPSSDDISAFVKRACETQIDAKDIGIGPGGVQTIRIENSGDLSRGGQEKVQAGAVSVYMAGRIIYEDVFRQTRKTEFCYQYFAPIGIMTYPKHNAME